MRFTVHQDILYDVEAESAEEALRMVEENHDRPPASKFHIPVESASFYVTDEDGETVS